MEIHEPTRISIGCIDCAPVHQFFRLHPVECAIRSTFLPRPQGNIFSFDNHQQIEVLRGPQGTFLDRNASSVVINIITKSPSATPSADFSIGYGTYNTLNASGYVVVGLTKGVAVDLADLYDDQHGARSGK